ncbi:MAG: DUF4339 domain-containing protein, partial [Polyangiales bacterium]
MVVGPIDATTAADTAPGAVTAPGGDDALGAGATAAVWHVGINDVPVGPLTSAELGRRIASGVVDPQSLVWREGFADWQPLGQVRELANVLRAHRPPPVAGRTLRLSGPDAAAVAAGVARGAPQQAPAGPARSKA